MSMSSSDAFATNSGRGRRRRGRRSRGALSEINVTPLVDVMLVLLIIFMISAPLLTAGVPLELPKLTPMRPLVTSGSPMRPACCSASSAERVAICATRPMLRMLLRL